MKEVGFGGGRSLNISEGEQHNYTADAGDKHKTRKIRRKEGATALDVGLGVPKMFFANWG